MYRISVREKETQKPEKELKLCRLASLLIPRATNNCSETTIAVCKAFSFGVMCTGTTSASIVQIKKCEQELRKDISGYGMADGALRK